MSDPRTDPVTEQPAELEEAVGLGDRGFDSGRRSLREHAARGTMINSAFQAGIASLGALQRIVVAAFLTRSEFGIWGIVLVTLVTLSWLKELGIADKFIQQAEPDQAAAFQKAFTLELVASVAFFALCAVLLPLYAIAYGQWRILPAGLLLAASVPISAFEAPLWISYRRMQFVRQRTLGAVDPVVAFAVTVALAVAGAGYWCLVIGVVAGSVAGAIVCTISSPYPVRLRFERGTLGEYARFSWPLVGFGVGNLIVVQGTVLAANRSVGLAGIGVIGLTASITQLASRLDTIINQTIYPAVCAIADRRDRLLEAFVKSNRLTLMWSMPFGVGLALFSGDLVHYVLGDRWQPAVGLLAATGLVAGVSQIGYNWPIFFRAVNDTRPIFFAALVNVAVFLALGLPLVLTLGLTGFALGLAASTLAQLAVRAVFVRRLFPGFGAMLHTVRAIAPSVPAAAAVLGVRVLAGHTTSLPRTLAELALYAGVTLLATLVFERRLLAESLGYLFSRGRGGGQDGVAGLVAPLS